MVKKEKGFSLLELLVAIAIIGILSAVVFVSVTGIRKRARSTRALAQLSSVLPSMYSCWGNGGEVREPDADGGGNICYSGSTALTGYGTWPAAQAGDLATWRYPTGWNACTEDCPSGGTENCLSNADGWCTGLISNATNDSMRVCCNGTMKNCKIEYDLNSDGDYNDAGEEGCGKTVPTN